MSGRRKGWLFGGWLVLVVVSWSFTESINDGIEPTSGPRPEPTSSSSSPACSAPTPTPTPTPTSSEDALRYLIAYRDSGTRPDVVATAIACKIAD